MEMTAEQVQAWLQMLKAEGVEEFEGCGFHVRFGPGAAIPRHAVSVDPPQRPSVVKQPHSMWEDPHLWPGGEPPRFQGEE